MNSFPLFLVVAALLLLCLLPLSLARLIECLRHARLRRSLRACRAALPGPDAAPRTLAAWRRGVFQVLQRLSRRALYRLACDPAQPDWLRDMLATHVLARYGLPSVLREAAGEGWMGAFRRRRIGALQVLYLVRAPGLHALLRKALAQADRRVKAAALVLLGRLRDREAGAVLVSALQRNWYAPARVAGQLAGFPVAMADLLLPLLDPAWPGPARPSAARPSAARPQVQAWAILTLARGNLHAAAPPLAPGMARALDRIGAGRPSVAGLAPGDTTQFDTSFARARAARAVGRLFTPAHADFAPLVAPMLAERDWWLRLAAREALLAMGAAAALDVATQLLSPDRLARDGARLVLKRIGLARGGHGGDGGAKVIAFPRKGTGAGRRHRKS